jgi:hypothetical protein
LVVGVVVDRVEVVVEVMQTFLAVMQLDMEPEAEEEA